MKIEVRPLEYRVLMASPGLGETERFVWAEKQSGYAVNSPTDVRYCVGLVDEVYWVATHYDSGARFGEVHATKRACIDAAEAELKKRIADGSLQKAIDEAQPYVLRALKGLK